MLVQCMELILLKWTQWSEHAGAILFFGDKMLQSCMKII